MERFSQRESVHLRYSPQSSFVNDHFSPNTKHRNSDIDFNDVFGGPPRRSSMHEIRFSYSEATDNDAFRGDDGTVASRNSWTGLSEKPVFGEEGLNRMPYNTSENFFNDIFKGHESLSSSPRKREWDPYSSSPAGSRVLSPARPLPPQAEPFETSLPAQFSLPAKLTRGMDLPTFGSAPRSPYKSKDSASNGIRPSYCFNQGHEERNDSRSSYRQSLLSRELSVNSKEPSDLIKHDDTDTGGNLEKESDSSEVLANGNQFHFSIYKWASKGVPLAMPICGGNSSRSRENSNAGRGTSSDGWIASERELPTETLHEAKLPSNDGVSASTKSFTIEHDKQNNSTPDTSTQDKVAMVQRVDPGDTTSYSTGEQTKSHSQSEIGLHNKLEKEASVVDEEAHKPELKPLCSLFYDNDYEQSNVEVTKKANEKERTVKSTEKSSVVPDFSKNVKKQDGKRASLDSAQVGKGSLQGPPMNSGDPGKIGVKGKVKEFVKIFNQESLSKSKINVDPSSQSSRWKDTGSSKAEKEANFSKNGTDEKIHLSSGHKKKSSLDAPIMVNGNLRYSEKQSSAIKNTNRMSNGTSRQKDASSTGSGSKAFVGDIDDSFQENVLVKELIQDENKLPKAGSDPEEIQVIDAKIRKWSNGKEGNIRSLLSTLQYVLWTESGWKTVPLVDIIDGNAVKRSYQKALLYLHPDKLQQKGATSQQKYIAEKVFDILQDAWTHFNSLGSL